MAPKSVDKRAERRAKDERNMNRAVVLLIGGLIAEWYLLMADRFYAKGNVTQMLAWYDYLGLMRWIGLAVCAAGAACFVTGKKPLVKNVGLGLGITGAFFSLTSFAMRHVYPTSVTVLCVVIPVLLILGIIVLFYQAEFAIQSMALAMAMGALVLMNRSGSSRVKLCAMLAIIGIAALCAMSWYLQRSKGLLGLKDGRKLRIIGIHADYRLVYGVLGLCLALLLGALFIPQLPFYGTWALAAVTFVLAVYYTVKLM